MQSRDARGVRPYSPRMMTALLLYAYCVGLVSSRKSNAPPRGLTQVAAEWGIVCLCHNLRKLDRAVGAMRAVPR